MKMNKLGLSFRQLTTQLTHRLSINSCSDHSFNLVLTNPTKCHAQPQQLACFKCRLLSTNSSSSTTIQAGSRYNEDRDDVTQSFKFNFRRDTIIILLAGGETVTVTTMHDGNTDVIRWMRRDARSPWQHREFLVISQISVTRYDVI